MLWCCCAGPPTPTIIKAVPAIWYTNANQAITGFQQGSTPALRKFKNSLAVGLDDHTSFLFRTSLGLGIPPGATINLAVMRYATGGQLYWWLQPWDVLLFGQIVQEPVTTDVLKARFYGHDVDDSTPMTSYATCAAAVRTTAFVDWDPVNDPVGPTGNIPLDCPNLAPILQEVVDRPGYTANSHVTIFCDERNSTVFMYQASPTQQLGSVNLVLADPASPGYQWPGDIELYVEWNP